MQRNSVTRFNAVIHCSSIYSLRSNISQTDNNLLRKFQKRRFERYHRTLHCVFKGLVSIDSILRQLPRNTVTEEKREYFEYNGS